MGDVQNCNNYRGIKLLRHTMKVWERLLDGRLRRCVSISENQFGFMPGRSTTEAIHIERDWWSSIERTRTEYLECKFSDVIQEVEGDVRLDTQVISRREIFKYLRSIIQKDGEIDEDVIHRIRADWMEWRLAFGVLCDKNVSLRLKGKFYKVIVRQTILYGEECWLVKNFHVQQMKVAEMRMLRWMCGHTRLDRIRNEVIRDKVGVAHVESMMRESRLRWFGHVKRRSTNAPIRRCESLVLASSLLRRGRGKVCIYTTLPRPHLLNYTGFFVIVVVVVVICDCEE
uniref:Reverse transcriptase domain-containing protein n=1 Tax=Nicotiana tabacum TaxID=4097 RepID=A0A1S3ZT65_TOBAC|nr:PREDICTED: uncharacterized protein LOC107790145 [Nicotiana tabacum]